MAYVAAAAAWSIPFVAARRHGRRSREAPVGLPDPARDIVESAGACHQSLGDAAESIHIALKRLAPVIANRSVRIDVAARRGLIVRMRGPVLADLMEELIAAVLHSAPASALLLTAAPHGDRIYISLTDDVPATDSFVRQAVLRGVTERVALRGGALDVRVRPNEGTTVTLRVMAAFEAPAADAVQAGSSLSAPITTGAR